MDYRPPSKRDVFDPDLDTLHEHAMPWMVKPLARWISAFITGRSSQGSVFVRHDFIEDLEMATRQHTPFTRTIGVVNEVENRMMAHQAFGIDAVAYALSRLTGSPTHPASQATALYAILEKSGSAWEVTPITDTGTDVTNYVLTRRDLAAAKAAISEARSQHQRAGAFLFDAWAAVATRDPRPNEGYDKAVKAIEAAAQPVVSPNDTTATLGKMLSAMRAKPEKWTFALGDLDLIIGMAGRVWTEHMRHGTDQRRTDHTLQEADAALHLAIPLVRYFSGGLIVLAER